MTEGTDEWISASEAKAMGPAGTAFTTAIIMRAAAGLVRAKATLLIRNNKGRKSTSRTCKVPKDLWQHCKSYPDWNAGDFSFTTSGQPNGWMGPDGPDAKAFGVTFARANIVTMLPSTDAAVEEDRNTTDGVISRGGRPPACNWENVMVEMARQLYCGDLTPRCQADVERAILTHLNTNNSAVGESTAREHARPLWQAISGPET